LIVIVIIVMAKITDELLLWNMKNIKNENNNSEN